MNDPGAIVTDPNGPSLPPPPPEAPTPPMTFGLRPIAVGGLCLLVAGVAALFAYKTLWPYPLRHADENLAFLVVGAGAVGLVTGQIRAPGRRTQAVTAAIVLSVALPFLAVTFLPGVAQPPSHAIPGGPTQAITAAPDGSFDLYVEPDGDPSKLIELTDTAQPERWAQLSPDGTQIAYTLFQPDGATDLRLMTVGSDGAVTSDELALAGDGTHELSVSGWAPDGSLVVMLHDPVRGTSATDTLDLDTGELTPWLAVAGNVSFDPTGSKIAFARPSRSDPDDWDIWVADADGRHAHDLFPLAGLQDFPAWSPDGDRIVFTSWSGANADVFIVNADGSGVTNLTSDSMDTDTSQGWTPDGHVLFLSNRSHTGGTFLYFMDADGKNVRLAVRL
jgi:Tol biopolymer transport system component